MDKSLLISKSVLIILTICEEFIFGTSSYVENRGIQGLLENVHLFAREKAKKYMF